MKDKKAKKYEQPAPTRVGRKKKKKSGPAPNQKLPDVKPSTKCRLRLLKLDRVNDYLLMEQEFVARQEQIKPMEEKAQEERSKIDDIRGTPMGISSLEEMIDDNHAIISSSVGPEYYVNIMSFVDKDQLEPGCSLLTHNKVNSIVGLLGDEVDPMVSVMKVDKAPTESYADIGGLETQIQEIKEAVELPLTHPELYEDIGIKPPKGVIFYGPPGTGKTLLAKAVANETSATFLRVVGSELIQKYLGDGPKMVRELFRVADEHAPSIVFIDEIDAVGSKRYDSSSGGEREIQRTMLELLNQLDGFDERGDVKVIMATNAIESLDPALLRPVKAQTSLRLKRGSSAPWSQGETMDEEEEPAEEEKSAADTVKTAADVNAASRQNLDAESEEGMEEEELEEEDAPVKQRATPPVKQSATPPVKQRATPPVKQRATPVYAATTPPVPRAYAARVKVAAEVRRLDKVNVDQATANARHVKATMRKVAQASAKVAEASVSRQNAHAGVKLSQKAAPKPVAPKPVAPKPFAKPAAKPVAKAAPNGQHLAGTPTNAPHGIAQANPSQ